ncbi:cysteine desulfurase, SufS subfamily [Gracilinema caldarium DSM 7334]|uniref:Probable cysteine desulfurase n=2 Tax=Gracilinema caldarium TaxID=215591 RepID=F8EZX3_GRAC1|nr:cysteine desulfurase, SufS subfamily [Gracilinema caldarium DSM 7334]
MNLMTETDQRVFSSTASSVENSKFAKALKAEFPIFHAYPDLIYTDNGATTQKPARVLVAEQDFYTRSCANVHRAIYTLGEEATSRYEEARKTIAEFIGAKPEECIFTRGTTEAINLLAHSFGETLSAGDEIILTEMEHHANIVPWQQLASRRGIKLRYIPIYDDGILNLDILPQLLNRRTKLIAVTMISNVLGTRNHVEHIIAQAHSAGVPVLLDAAQAIPVEPINVKELDADFVAFSGHKMYGPFGIGLLYGTRKWLEALPPFMGGGDMISEVGLEGFTPNEVPYKFEAGTPPIAQAVGMAEAARWLSSIGHQAAGNYESELGQLLIDEISLIPGLRILGAQPGFPLGPRAGIVSVTLEGVHAHDLAAYLNRHKITVRAGHHCAHPLAQRLGVVSSARFSFGAYNTREEVFTIAEILQKAHKELL